MTLDADTQAALDRGDLLEAPAAEVVAPVVEDNPVTGEPAAVETAPAAATPEDKGDENPPAVDAVAEKAETSAPGEVKDPAAEVKPAKKDDVRVPKSRLDEALQHSRKLQERIDQLEQQRATGFDADATATKLDELEVKYAEALTEGDKDTALQLRKEIRTLERAQMQAEMNYTREVAPSQVTMQQVLNETISHVETAYPELNPDAPEFNEALSKQAIDLMEDLAASGKYTQAEAIARAARLVALENGIADRTAAPKVDPAPAVSPAQQRVTEAVKTAVAAANSQPPAAKVGVSSDSLGGPLTAEVVGKMSQKEFDALDEKTKSALRGDTM